MSIHDLTSFGAIRPDVFSLLEIGLCIVDENQIIRTWNDQLQRRGVPRDEAEGRRLSQVLTPLCSSKAKKNILKTITNVLVSGAPEKVGPQYRVRFPDPIYPEYSIICAPLEGERRVALLFQSQCERETLRRHYERILDSTPDGIMVIDPDRRIRIFNKACGELLGRNPADVLRTSCMCNNVVNCHMEDGTSLADKFCPAQSIFNGDEKWQVQQMLTANSAGEERWIETTYSSIADEDGNVQFVIGVIRDIHERKVLEGKLHQTERLAAMGQLTAGIAHEIKNPLGIIQSSVQIILDDARPEEMKSEAATFIRDEVHRLDHRLRSFLEFARPHPPQPEPFVLNGLIRRTVRTLEGALKQVEIEMSLSREEAIVHLDPHQFVQVITNLLLNAAEAMKDGGRILVRTRNTEDHVQVEVHDAGPGIPEEIRKSIFDPFFTTKAHGTGLGLSIVYQIVSSFEGSVQCGRSKELDGALFTLSLPFQSTV